MRLNQWPVASLLVGAIVSLAGCASIPLSTAVRMSSLSPRALAQLDPAAVRVRLAVPDGFEVDVPRCRLSLEVTGGDQSSTAAMSLRLLLRTSAHRPNGWFSPDLVVNLYELALTDDGVRQLRQMQQTVLAHEGGSVKFAVTSPFSSTPPNATEVMFWVDIKLASDAAYWPLIDGATLRFTPQGMNDPPGSTPANTSE
ncbi:MAG TPA: hypothetical protein VFN09_04750 [Rhodanobacteraceae bacterium]|nr:hypothetical protein [Rhodanobacteraceae bacterium]